MHLVWWASPLTYNYPTYCMSWPSHIDGWNWYLHSNKHHQVSHSSTSLLSFGETSFVGMHHFLIIGMVVFQTRIKPTRHYHWCAQQHHAITWWLVAPTSNNKRPVSSSSSLSCLQISLLLVVAISWWQSPPDGKSPGGDCNYFWMTITWWQSLWFFLSVITRCNSHTKSEVGIAVRCTSVVESLATVDTPFTKNGVGLGILHNKIGIGTRPI